MKVSKIKEMKNYQTFEDEEVKLNTTIVSEKSSWLDKVAEIFFKHDKIIYRFIDLSILIGLFVLIASILKQNNNAVILIGLMEIILGAMRYKIGILGYWHLNKDLPIFEKKRFGNDRTNLVWYNVFPKTKEIEKPSEKEGEVLEYLRKINNQVNKKVLEFYLFSIMGMFTFFAFMAIVIAKYYPTIAGAIVFSAITLLCVTLGLSANKRDILSLAENNFNVKMRTITFDKGVIIKVSFYVKTSYQIDDVIKTSEPYEMVKILQKFT